MVWRVIYHSAIQSDLASLGHVEASRILKVITERIQHGKPDEIGKPLRGPLIGCRRIRAGSTRIVYRVDTPAGHNPTVVIPPKANRVVQRDCDDYFQRIPSAARTGLATVQPSCEWVLINNC